MIEVRLPRIYPPCKLLVLFKCITFFLGANDHDVMEASFARTSVDRDGRVMDFAHDTTHYIIKL